MPDPLQRIALLILRLAQMRVQPDAVLPGQDRALAQQLRRDRERRARRQGHPAHGLERTDRDTSSIGGSLLWRRISSTSCTTLSGGRPPSFFERSMLPRDKCIRTPSCSAACALRPQQVPGIRREDVVVVKARWCSRFSAARPCQSREDSRTVSSRSGPSRSHRAS